MVQSKNVTLPPKERILDAMRLTQNSPEGAAYLSKQAHRIVEKSKVLNKTDELKEMAKQVLSAIDEYAEFVRLKQPTSDKIWTGQPPEKSESRNLQKAIAQQAMGDLMGKSFASVRFDFAVSAEGHFVRGYGPADKGATSLDPNDVESLDKLFNAWLAEKHDIVTEEGFLFKTDEAGKREKLGAGEVEALMADSAKEFQDYLHEKGGFELISRQREYPGETRLQELKQVAEERMKTLLEAETELEQETVVEPDATGPSTHAG